MTESFFTAFVDELGKIAQMRQAIPGMIGPGGKAGPTTYKPIKLQKPKVENRQKVIQKQLLPPARARSKTQVKPQTQGTQVIQRPVNIMAKKPKAPTESPTMDYAQMMMMQQAMTPRPTAEPKRPWGTPRPKVHEGI